MSAGKLDLMDESPGNNLAIRMLQARQRKRLTQVQAGDLLGKTHATIGQWERGETLPELENLVAAAELYDASLDWLVWGEAMGSGIEVRLRKIPDILRPGLIQRLHEEIDKTEEAAKRLPPQMAGPPIKDRDPRLTSWLVPKKKTRRSKGENSK